MKHIVFDMSFDSGAWPGPLGDDSASAGEIWVGLAGFVSCLETELGLARPPVRSAHRRAALVPTMVGTRGFWSESAGVDPLGSARELLRWRDFLRLHGWRGDALAPRLEQLAAVTADVCISYPGIADRLEAVEDALGSRGTDIELVTVFEPTDVFPKTVRDVFDALGRHCTDIRKRDLEPATAAGDLAGAREADFAPVGDGSLQLIRPHGPVEAAEEVAAWLSGQGDTEGTVLIGTDPILDAALRRHGLPTTGAPGASHSNGLLQALPLVLSMAWTPADPQRAIELLTLPRSPIPRSVGRALGRALHDWPAVGSGAWNEAMAESLEKIEDPKRRQQIRRRLEAIFNSFIARGQPYPAEEISRRVSVLLGWIHGNLSRADDPVPWAAAATQCAALEELVGLSGYSSLTGPQLDNFLALSSDAIAPLGPFDAEAGVSVVGSPGSIVGPARRVIWWSFTLDSIPSPQDISLTAAERAALQDAGVVLPDPGDEAERIAAAWRRPLEQATEAMVLVCPERDLSGEESYPHYLWDEIAASLAEGRSLSPVTSRRAIGDDTPPRETVERLALPVPQARWRIESGRVTRRETESPSSVGCMIGCSFKWLVDYFGKARFGLGAALSDLEDSAMIGTILHFIIQTILEDPAGFPADPAAEARRIFDQTIPRLAAPLFLPGAESARVTIRTAAAASADGVVQLFRDNGLTVRATEEAVAGTAFGGAYRGIPDIVTGPGNSIIDLKWGGLTYRRRSLERGTSYQLASYAYLVSGGNAGDFPEAAYYIMRSRRLVGPSGAFGRGGVDGPSLVETWNGLNAAHEAVWTAVEQGQFTATANDDDPPEEDALEDGVLVLAPPCGFCDYAALCGKAFA